VIAFSLRIRDQRQSLVDRVVGRIVYLRDGIALLLQKLKVWTVVHNLDLLSFLVASHGLVDTNKGRQITRKAGIAGPFGFHTLRRTLASALVANGSDVRLVQELLLHSSPLIMLDALCSFHDTGEDRSSGMGDATANDGEIESRPRDGKTRQHTNDVSSKPTISPLLWVATHIGWN